MLNQVRLADVPRLSADEAKELMDRGTALFVDVRKHDYFQRVRIAGAISVPLRGPADRYWQLPRDRDIIIY